MSRPRALRRFWNKLQKQRKEWIKETFLKNRRPDYYYQKDGKGLPGSGRRTVPPLEDDEWTNHTDKEVRRMEERKK